MSLSRSRMLYLIAMLVSGIAIGFIVAGQPALQEVAVPPIIWPLIISLLLDLVLMQAAARGKAEPLTMGDRAIGVIGAGLLVTMIPALQG